MRETLDQLIEERAPWFRRGGPHVALAHWLLNRVLQYDRSLKIAEALEPMPARDIMAALADLIALHVDVAGIENVPRTGPAMVVSNHPTGIADGIVLYGALAQRRPDLFFFANADAIRILPQLEDLIAPVEWRPERRTHKQNRETMAYAHKAFADGRLAVLFPSGRLAKRRWWSLHERPWLASGAMLVRKYNLPVCAACKEASHTSSCGAYPAPERAVRPCTSYRNSAKPAPHCWTDTSLREGEVI